ncbi:MAG: transposase [Planctomycetaceae bacterium]|nr:transposase [Planctomycetaceae bacterium]
MFFRQKRSGKYRYLQIVENRWEDGRSKQRVIVTLGRLDELREQGQLDGLLRSGAKLSQAAMLLTAQQKGELPVIVTKRIGPELIFQRLWSELKIPQVLTALLAPRRFEFPIERVVFLTVLHRLLHGGSDRNCMSWKDDYHLPGTETLQLHQMYRAMAWLGEPLGKDDQDGATPFAPRCIKDQIEEGLFHRRRDLFSELALVFYDTTSIYFEGRGGETIGQYGHSKDHRPDRVQMVVGVVLDGQGRPLCCELWPGNITDVKTLLPIVDRLRKRFAIRSVCVVADRGMISQGTIEELQSAERRVHYVLGARLRSVKEIREKVLSHPGRYREVHGPKEKSGDPAPLQVKNVRIDGRRYVVCLNVDQAKKDRADRDAIVAALEEQLQRGDKSLVGNRGYRKYLKSGKTHFEIDQQKIKSEARYDGKWVLRTDLNELSAEEVALRYKQLWMVEDCIRSIKSILETRPIFHHHDETIRGHVFCSFLALVIRKELQDRLTVAGHSTEWADVLRDLESLQSLEVEYQGKRFRLRSEARGTCSQVFQAVGVAFPPTMEHVID